MPYIGMLKAMFSRPRGQLAAGGWIVEVTVPTVGAKEPMQRLFAVAAAERTSAERLARDVLGNLHCAIQARVKLTPRALGHLKVADGDVQEIDND
jgi:hypothetical protein